MNRMVACAAWPMLMICRPPLAVASSDSTIEPPGKVTLMSTCTEPPERRAASAPRSRAGADLATDAARGLAPGDDPADEAALPPDAVAAGGAEPLPLQPASAPSPSSAIRVSAIVLTRVCRRV